MKEKEIIKKVVYKIRINTKKPGLCGKTCGPGRFVCHTGYCNLYREVLVEATPPGENIGDTGEYFRLRECVNEFGV